MIDSKSIKFSKTHEWARQDEDELVIGITNHAQHLLGDLVFIELPEVGREIEQGAEFGVVESVKAASDIYAPLSGTITAINDAVKRDPSLVNQDPLGAGWLVKLKARDLTDLQGLLDSAQYEAEIAKDH